MVRSSVRTLDVKGFDTLRHGRRQDADLSAAGKRDLLKLDGSLMQRREVALQFCVYTATVGGRFKLYDFAA